MHIKRQPTPKRTRYHSNHYHDCNHSKQTILCVVGLDSDTAGNESANNQLRTLLTCNPRHLHPRLCGSTAVHAHGRVLGVASVPQWCGRVREFLPVAGCEYDVIISTTTTSVLN